MTYEHASVEIDGAKLRRLRKEAGMTVQALADKVGVSISYLAAVERGARKTVAPARYIQICSILGLDRASLYATDGVAA